MGTGVVEQLSPQQFCTECGRAFAVEDLVRFGDSVICSDCKPIYVQRMREGAMAAPTSFGGFWRRAVATWVDSAVFFSMIAPFLYLGMILLFISLFASGFSEPPRLSGFTVAGAIPLGLLLLIGPFFYESYFTTHGGSTPGKMMMGLKTVTAQGAAIGTGQSVGRIFAKILSSMMFYIGYFIAGFDSQKRALHDRICETRVVRIEPTVMGRRIGAYFLDVLFIVVISNVVSITWFLIHGMPLLPPMNPDSTPAELSNWARSYFAQILIPTLFTMALQIVYYVYFTSQKGATPGKSIAGVQVVTGSGGKVSVGRAFARYFSFVFVNPLTLGIGLSIAFFDKEGRALHDRICSTRVVRAGA